MKTEKQRKFAAAGGLCGAFYLVNGLWNLPDFIMGIVLGVAIVLLALALLPEEALEKLRKWKRRG